MKPVKPLRAGRAMGCMDHRGGNRANDGCEPCQVLMLLNQSRPGYRHPKPRRISRDEATGKVERQPDP